MLGRAQVVGLPADRRLEDSAVRLEPVMTASASGSTDVALGSRRSSRALLAPRWMTWPAVVYLLVMTQIPFAVTFVLSLYRWNLLHPERGLRFVGVGNYASLLADRLFQLAILNTAVFTIVPVIITALLGLALALLLHRMTFGRRLAYVLLVAPFLVMETVSPLIWKNMILNPIYGIANWLLQVFGLAPIDLIGQHPKIAIITIVVWQWAPFMMLVLLTGLQSLPPSLLEAAALDGAGAPQIFVHITVSHLVPYFVVGMLLETILLLPMFGPIYVTTYGGPGYSTQNLTFEMYRLLTQQYEVGSAAAGGILTGIIVTIVTIVLFQRLRPSIERR